MKKKTEKICFNGNEFVNLDNEQLQVYKDKFPDIDISREIKRMEAWLITNPHRRKKDYNRFIINWLLKTQGKSKGQKGRKIADYVGWKKTLEKEIAVLEGKYY